MCENECSVLILTSPSCFIGMFGCLSIQLIIFHVQMSCVFLLRSTLFMESHFDLPILRRLYHKSLVETHVFLKANQSRNICYECLGCKAGILNKLIENTLSFPEFLPPHIVPCFHIANNHIDCNLFDF